jgi:hypothetical protein
MLVRSILNKFVVRNYKKILLKAPLQKRCTPVVIYTVRVKMEPRHGVVLSKIDVARGAAWILQEIFQLNMCIFVKLLDVLLLQRSNAKAFSVF